MSGDKQNTEHKKINKVFLARSNPGISKQAAFAGINLYKSNLDFNFFFNTLSFALLT